MEGGREQNYWPGFVDALSNVVLTLIFVLVIFVFALLMASQKVKAKMQEVKDAQKAEAAGQVQLNQALAELEQLHSQEQNDPNKSANPSSQQQSCLRFNKSDATQKTEVDPDGTSLLILFSANAISITDDTTKTIHDFLDAYRAKNGDGHTKFAIESSEDPTSVSPLLARETQLGRMLNVRNSLLGDKVEPRDIVIHNIAPQQQKDSYNWVKVYVEK